MTPKAEESNYIGNTLPLSCSAFITSQTHTHPQVPSPLPTHTTHLPPTHTHTQIYATDAQYTLQLEQHGIAEFHLCTLEVLQLRNIQRTLTPLVAHTVLEPTDDPSDSHLPPDCRE
jgi:hypothetical protein